MIDSLHKIKNKIKKLEWCLGFSFIFKMLFLRLITTLTFFQISFCAISGGEYCIFVIIKCEGNTDVECGIPSADLPSLREDASSITGYCENSVCKCSSGYGCGSCFVQLIPDSNGELSGIRRFVYFKNISQNI